MPLWGFLVCGFFVFLSFFLASNIVYLLYFMVRSYWGSHQDQLSFADILGLSQARAQYWSKTCCFAELLSSVLRQESQSHPYFFRQTTLPCLMLLTAITSIFALLGFLPNRNVISHIVLWTVVLTTAVSTDNGKSFSERFKSWLLFRYGPTWEGPETRAFLQTHLL